jgi:hypothetical protein
MDDYSHDMVRSGAELGNFCCGRSGVPSFEIKIVLFKSLKEMTVQPLKKTRLCGCARTFEPDSRFTLPIIPNDRSLCTHHHIRLRNGEYQVQPFTGIKRRGRLYRHPVLADIDRLAGGRREVVSVVSQSTNFRHELVAGQANPDIHIPHTYLSR